MKNEKIVEHWDVINSTDLLHQIGMSFHKYLKASLEISLPEFVCDTIEYTIFPFLIWLKNFIRVIPCAMSNYMCLRTLERLNPVCISLLKRVTWQITDVPIEGLIHVFKKDVILSLGSYSLNLDRAHPSKSQLLQPICISFVVHCLTNYESITVPGMEPGQTLGHEFMEL